jgi:GNAT superfamily N-acetyltransferase
MIAGVIRPARQSDLQILRQIELEAGAAFRDLAMDAIADDQLPSLDWLAEFQEDGRAWVVADDNDQAVAYLLAAELDGEALIEQVSVHPSRAHQRLGSELIHTAAEWGRAAGLSGLTLTTFDLVPWNRPYYQRLGFEVVDDQALSPGLREIRASEIERGLDRWPRVVMRRPISPQSPST